MAVAAKAPNEIGIALEDIIDSTKITTLKIVDCRYCETGLGDKKNIAQAPYFGGFTGGSQDNREISILLNRDVVNIANQAFKASDFIGTDRNILKMSFSAALAHELGHAWSIIRDQTGERWDLGGNQTNLTRENNDRAVRLENQERTRLGLPLRYQH